MRDRDNTGARGVKEVTELIHSQKWSFNDFLIVFYSSADKSIASQRGHCLTHSEGDRYTSDHLLDLWRENCPTNSRKYLDRVIVDHASRIIAEEANEACAP